MRQAGILRAALPLAKIPSRAKPVRELAASPQKVSRAHPLPPATQTNSQIALFFALNRIFFSANENETVKQNNQQDFKVFFKTNQSHCRKMKDKKAIVWQIWHFLLS